MGPNTLVRSRRWGFVLGMLFALAVLTATLSVILYIVRQDVVDLNTTARTAEVATCYATARSRPGLIVVLRIIAGVATTQADRDIVNTVIDQYEAPTPTEEECDMLAVQRGLDPADFPPPSPPKSGSREP